MNKKIMGLGLGILSLSPSLSFAAANVCGYVDSVNQTNMGAVTFLLVDYKHSVVKADGHSYTATYDFTIPTEDMATTLPIVLSAQANRNKFYLCVTTSQDPAFLRVAIKPFPTGMIVSDSSGKISR